MSYNEAIETLKPCSKCGGPRLRVGQRYCRMCHAEYMRANRPKHSELPKHAKKKANCRSYANTYQKKGLLVPKPCETCCSTERVEKHHDDYDQPLNVRWLCRSCHLNFHKEAA